MNRSLLWSLLLAMLFAVPVVWAASPEDLLATQLYDLTQFKGGLIVHVGCGDGKLTTALRRQDNALVQGLDTNATALAAAQTQIATAGLDGYVTVRSLPGTSLPYIDNLVNLVVVDNALGTDSNEWLRVTAPAGKICVRNGGSWDVLTKPRPATMDEWTHYLYSAANNPVSQDQLVAPPQFLQWTADPDWDRGHDWNPSYVALVSAGGRIFYIQDNGPIGVLEDKVSPPNLPERWYLCAQDAFNGLPLWSKPLSEYGWLDWEETGPTIFQGIENRWGAPLQVNRRVVTDGARVYAALEYRGPVSVIDATTGNLLAQYTSFLTGNESVDEILLTPDNKLILRIREVPVRTTDKGQADAPIYMNYLLNLVSERVVALNAATGALLWSKTTTAIAPEALAAHNGRVAYFTYKINDTTSNQIVCLDAATGTNLWQREVQPSTASDNGALYHKRGFVGNLLMWRDPTAGQDLVVFVGGKGAGFDAATGAPLWTASIGSGYGFASTVSSRIAGGSLFPNETIGKGYHPRTGAQNKTVSVSNLFERGHHLRCYRGKTTERYVITSHRGAEFVDLVATNHFAPDWLRGECSYGVMPANGLLYVPPNGCSCYNGSKLTGFLAVYGDHEPYGPNPPTISAQPRLEQGPAFGSAAGAAERVLPYDWPAYRRDAQRSGHSPAEVPATLSTKWDITLGGQLTPPVVAGGRVFVVRKDANQVVGLDAWSGAVVWRFTTSAPVDSPPTAYRGVVIFGSRDGYVYCLRAGDGVLAWKFRAAANDRQLMARGRLESVWPTHGSVLIVGDQGYVTAGRSSYMDGGIDLWALEPLTGAELHHTRIEGPWPTRESTLAGPPPEGKGYALDGVRTDILTCDSTNIYLFSKRFDLALNEIPTSFVTLPNGVTNFPGIRTSGTRLVSNDGFLDATLNNRKWWVYSDRWPGWLFGTTGAKQGRLLVFDDAKTYAANTWPKSSGRFGSYAPGDQSKLICDANTTLDRSQLEVTGSAVNGFNMDRTAPGLYSVTIPMIIDAMALTAGSASNLFLAGTVDPNNASDLLAPFDGRTPGLLWAVNPTNGTKRAEFSLLAPPVFDGLAAAGNRLFISTVDGHVLSLGAATDDPMFDTDGDGIPDVYETTHNLNWADPADAAGDRDGDGVPNLAEYAFNRDAAVPESTAPVTQTVQHNPDGDGKDYLTLTYHRRKVPGALSYTVEVSTNLADWNNGAAYSQELSAADDPGGVTQTVVTRIKPALPATGRLFARVRVRAP